ncbi:MAG: hypothetical protein IKN96_05940 [Oscillibacter sp.]|nr:hypothetical protein [Oscillibacter sp.]
MHAPSDGIPTPDALSSVQTPSDWYAQALTQGIQFMRHLPFPERFADSIPSWRRFMRFAALPPRRPAQRAKNAPGETPGAFHA